MFLPTDNDKSEPTYANSGSAVDSKPVAEYRTTHPGKAWQAFALPTIAGGIVFVTLVLLYFVLYEPILHVDDWSHVVYRRTIGSWQWYDPTNRRPLLFAPVKFIDLLFGLDIAAFYAVNATLCVVSALQFYQLLRRLSPSQAHVALMAAALFAVYPADYTRTYITMIGIRVAICLTLVSALALLSYAESRRPSRILMLLLALFSLLFSLGIYEAQLGLVVAWSFLILLLNRNASWRHRAGMLSPVVVALLFAAWRTIFLGASGAADNYLSMVNVEPSELLVRLVVGLRVLFIAWLEPIRRAIGGVGPGVSLLILYVLVAGAILLVWMLVRHRTYTVGAVLDEEKEARVRQSIGFMTGGVLFAVAGYLPMIAVWIPSLDGRFSRTTIFASFGAAMVIVSIFNILALYLGRNEKQIQSLFVAGLAPLLVLGLATQAWVQVDARIAWSEQRQMWQELFDLAPDLQPETAVYFVMPGFEERAGPINWQRTPLTESWEVTSALRALYDNPTLAGDVILPNVSSPQPIITRTGVINIHSGAKTPYNHTLFLYRDPNSGKLRILDDLDTVPGVVWKTPNYAPFARILSVKKPSIDKWRYLVDDREW